MWSSKPAFAISPKSQINNGKICSSLPRGYAVLEQHTQGCQEWCSWVAQFCPGVQVSSSDTSGEGDSDMAFPWGEEGSRRKSALQESSALFHSGEVTPCMNASEASISCRVNSSFISVSIAGYSFSAQYPDLILCCLHNYSEQCCVFPKGEIGQVWWKSWPILLIVCAFGLGKEASGQGKEED